MIVMANSLEAVNEYQDMMPYDRRERFLVFIYDGLEMLSF